MQVITWNRRYVDGEGWYLLQCHQSGRLPWELELEYGPFTYDEMIDAAEWIVFGYLEKALAELEHDQGAAQHDE